MDCICEPNVSVMVWFAELTTKPIFPFTNAYEVSPKNVFAVSETMAV